MNLVFEYLGMTVDNQAINYVQYVRQLLPMLSKLLFM